MANIIEGKNKQELKQQLNKALSVKYQKDFHPLEDSSLWRFQQFLFPEFFTDGKVPLKRISDAIQGAICFSMGYDGYEEYSKIMLNPHPRFGKSFNLSLGCVYGLGFNPTRSIMRNTSVTKLAEKFSRDIRNFIQLESERNADTPMSKMAGKLLVNKKINQIFPEMQLSVDKRSLDMWALKTAYDNSYICAGTSSTIVGMGCDLLGIIDDPYSGYKDACSSKYTDELINWYEGEHRRRFDVTKNVAEVIVMQRWNDDDMCARLLASEHDWNLIEFDVEKDLGLPEEDFELVESACEYTMPTNKLRKIKKAMYNNGTGNIYQAQYRSNVKSGENTMFPKEDLNYYSMAELNEIRKTSNYKVGALDFADEGEDFLCSIIGLLHEGKWYILPSLVFTTKSTTITRGLVTRQILDEAPIRHTFEANSGGKGFSEQVEDELKQYCIKGIVKHERNDTNKHTRILTFEGYIKNNFVFLQSSEVKSNSDYYWFMFHLIKYKRDASYKKDDAPDCLAQLAKQVRVKDGCSFGYL